MAALFSDNPLHAEMNKTYNIHVYECNGLGADKVPIYIHKGICSANKASSYINDEQLKIKLFNSVLDSGMNKCTKKIRNRLKMDFYLK